MLCRAFAATAAPSISARIVVTRSEEVQALCRAQGVPVLLHSLPGAMIPFGWGFQRCWSSCRSLAAVCFCPGISTLRRETVESHDRSFLP